MSDHRVVSEHPIFSEYIRAERTQGERDDDQCVKHGYSDGSSPSARSTKGKREGEGGRSNNVGNGMRTYRLNDWSSPVSNEHRHVPIASLSIDERGFGRGRRMRSRSGVSEGEVLVWAIMVEKW